MILLIKINKSIKGSIKINIVIRRGSEGDYGSSWRLKMFISNCRGGLGGGEKYRVRSKYGRRNGRDRE